VELDGQGGHTKIASSEYKFTKKEIAYAEGENRGQALFDRIAGQIQALVEEDRARTGRADETYAVGFIFSYPADLTDIRTATIREDAVGVKGFTAFRDVVGRNIVDLLGEALKLRGVSNVGVAAVANDTVGVQAVVTYQELGQGRSVPADIGLIVATGYNEAADLGPDGLRNFESGAYVPLEEYRTDLDRRLDEQSENPGEHLFEKMVSGKYLGELVRLAIQEQHLETGQFHWNRSRRWRRAAGRPYGFPSEFLSRLASGQTDQLLAELGVGAYSSSREKLLLESIARQVVNRSARLVAASLVATFRQIEGREELQNSHLVAADGSLFLYPGYENMIRRAMTELVGESAADRIQIRRTKDGTAVGGAVIAGAAQPAPVVFPGRSVQGYNHLVPPVQNQLQFPHATVTPTDREQAALFPALWADGAQGLSETPEEGSRASFAEAMRNQLARMRDREIGRLLWHQPPPAQVTMAKWLNEPENAGRKKSVLEAAAAEAARSHAGWLNRNNEIMEGSPEIVQEALAVIVSLSSDLGMADGVEFLSQLARIYNLERTVQRAAYEENSIGRPPAADQENKPTVRSFYLPLQRDTQDDLTVLPTHQGTVDRLMEAIQAIERNAALSDQEKRAAARNLVVFSANPNIGPAQFEIYLKNRIGFANHSLLVLAESIRLFTPREHAGLVGEDGRADVGVLARFLGGEAWFDSISLSVITASYDDLNLEAVREHVRLFIVNALGKVVPMDIRESIEADLYVLIQA
jgi:hexokinase